LPEVKIRLFGAFRNLRPQQEPELEISITNETVTVSQFKEHLAAKLRDSLATAPEQSSFDLIGLLQKSAIANDTAFLLETDHVRAGDRLALLPPVSGG
jgi:molybdopterin converting factor small subunit